MNDIVERHEAFEREQTRIVDGYKAAIKKEAPLLERCSEAVLLGKATDILRADLPPSPSKADLVEYLIVVAQAYIRAAPRNEIVFPLAPGALDRFERIVRLEYDRWVALFRSWV